MHLPVHVLCVCFNPTHDIMSQNFFRKVMKTYTNYMADLGEGSLIRNHIFKVGNWEFAGKKTTPTPTPALL